MRAAFGDALVELSARDERVMVVDCETGTATNVMGFRDAFPRRFVSVRVAEQSAVSFAFGISQEGMIPFFPLFASFLTCRACDQISIQIGYAGANVKLIGCYAGPISPNTGATHQYINDLSIIRSIPGFTVLEPADIVELRQMIFAATSILGPIYMRMTRGDLAEYEINCNFGDYNFILSKAPILRWGRGISLLASGIMVPPRP